MFKKLAQQVCNRLKNLGIHCHITSYNKFNNSVYVRLGDLSNEYNGIRFSNHQGKLREKYSLRTDINQSQKLIYGRKKYNLYCLNDINGMILKIIKEQNDF